MTSNDLVMANCDLVKWTINRIKIPGYIKRRCWDDLVQAGYVGLCEAVWGYDPKRGPFERMAISSIRHAVIKELRLSSTIILPHWHFRADSGREAASILKAKGFRISRARWFGIDEIKNTVAVLSCDSDESLTPEYRKVRDRFRREVEALSPGTKAVMDLHLRGYNHPEIGRELGIHPKAAQKRYLYAVNKIRKQIKK